MSYDSSKPMVHVLWDIDRIRIASSEKSTLSVVQKVSKWVSSCGPIVTFKCFGGNESLLKLDGKIKRELQESGIDVEDCSLAENGATNAVVTSLLKITLSLQLQSQWPVPRPVLVIASDHSILGYALNIVKRSGIFSDIFIIHNKNGSLAESLQHIANECIVLDDIINGEAKCPKSEIDELVSKKLSQQQLQTLLQSQLQSHNEIHVQDNQQGGSSRLVIVRPPPIYVPVPVLSSNSASSSSSVDNITSGGCFSALPTGTNPPPSGVEHFNLSSEINDVQSPWLYRSNSIGSSTPNMNIQPWEHNNHHQITPGEEETLEYSSHSKATTPSIDTQWNINQPEEDPWSGPIPTPPPYMRNIESRMSVLSTSTSQDSTTNNQNMEFLTKATPVVVKESMNMLHLDDKMLPPQARSMIVLFYKIMAYCEQERIIPRESVVRKRLLDTKVGSEIPFDDLCDVVKRYDIGIIEGEATQQIYWPKAGKFPCCDFFTPQERIPSSYMEELLAFLQKHKPEVDRGRFGFAQYLARHGPSIIRSLPFGVLVELVQLMLNRKLLLFRKGKISVPDYQHNRPMSLPSSRRSSFALNSPHMPTSHMSPHISSPSSWNPSQAQTPTSASSMNTDHHEFHLHRRSSSGGSGAYSNTQPPFSHEASNGSNNSVDYSRHNNEFKLSPNASYYMNSSENESIKRTATVHELKQHETRMAYYHHQQQQHHHSNAPPSYHTPHMSHSSISNSTSGAGTVTTASAVDDNFSDHLEGASAITSFLDDF